jgi:acetyl esterase/lipase
VHGGGFVIGDRKMGALMGRRLAARGIPVVAPGYRLCPDASLHEQLDDLTRALETIVASAGRFGLDAERYALIGESAGAHLAMRLLAERPEIARPRAAVGFYGAYDLGAYRRRDSRVFDAFLRTVGRGGDIDALVRAHHAVRELPFTDMPVLLVHGSADRFVPVQNSIALARCFEAQGVPVELTIYPGAGHGFNYQTVFRPEHTAASFLELEDFFLRHVPAPHEAP